MYKEIVISVICIILIFCADYFSRKYTKESIGKMKEDLESFKTEFLNVEDDIETKEDIEEEIKNIYNQWKDINEKSAFYLEHDELEKVETQLTQIKGNVEVGEYEEANVSVDECMFILNHIEEKDTLSIKNIF